MDYGRICVALYFLMWFKSFRNQIASSGARRYAVSQKIPQDETSINFVSLDLECSIVKAGGMY